MSSPTTSLKARDKQKVIDDEVLDFGDLENATGSGSSSGSSSDSNSGSDTESVSGLPPKTGAKEEPPLSRDDLLAYLENMRRRFLEKSTTDCFADQEEEVLIVTSKER